ncbi:MAG: SEC-C domain-containing protein [Bacillota bacterium]
MDDLTFQLRDHAEETYIETILDEHPELQILWRHLSAITSDHEINGVNPLLHVYFEAIAEAQIAKSDPPEAKDAAERLKERGFTGHAARGAVGALCIPHLYEALQNRKLFDRKGYARRLRVLGTSGGKPGRNEPCLCGSGLKYKRCCLPLGEIMTPSEYAGRLILGFGAYAGPEDLSPLPPDDPLLQLENRAHVAAYLAENGLETAAGEALAENISQAQTYRDGKFLKNALLHFLELSLENKGEFGLKGLEAIDRLLDIVDDDEEKGTFFCDKADILAALGRFGEARDTFNDLFNVRPGWHFGRYRYALFLLSWGDKEEAFDVLRELAADDDIDEETSEAVRELLEGLTCGF